MKNKIPNTQLPDHFKEFIIQLNFHEVEYLLIGGFAMGVYGHVRSTGDLDILIHATQLNAHKMFNACIDYGIEEGDLKEEMFTLPRMIGIGEPPLRIEILKNIGVVDFNYAFSRKNLVEIGGVNVNVVSIDGLILLKKVALKDRNKARDKEDYTFLNNLINRRK